jgi:hypothetical protein
VLALTFVDKGSEQVNIFLKQGEDEGWTNRKSYALKFADVGKLIYVEPGKGYSTKISLPRKESDLVSSAKEM